MCNTTKKNYSVQATSKTTNLTPFEWYTVIFFRGVTHEWMSSDFEVLLLFLFVVMSLLWSWDEIDVCVKLLTDDVWEVEDDKTGFLSIEVDSFDQLFLENDQFSYPCCKLVL